MESYDGGDCRVGGIVVGLLAFEHRRCILDARFRNLGTVAVTGDPVGTLAGTTTYAAEFGFVKRRK